MNPNGGWRSAVAAAAVGCAAPPAPAVSLFWQPAAKSKPATAATQTEPFPGSFILLSSSSLPIGSGILCRNPWVTVRRRRGFGNSSALWLDPPGGRLAARPDASLAYPEVPGRSRLRRQGLGLPLAPARSRRTDR